MQYSLLYLWHKMDCDMLILARTPPGWSFKNPAERIMSQLNLALQSVGVMRRAAGDWESKINKCNSMKEIRAAASIHGDSFVNAFSESIKPVKELLTELFSRVQWKGSNIEVN